jgi:uncharacterized membrane protein YfcA
VSLEYWFVFPVSVLFATIAMASGVEGATFFSPFFMLAMGFSPEVAIGTGLITEVFGFASGVYAYAHKKLIDYKLGRTLLVISIPMSLLGAWLSGVVPPDILKTIFGMGLLAVAVSFLRTPESNVVKLLDEKIDQQYGGDKAETCLVDRDGAQICYTVCNRGTGRIFSGVGGLFIGMISTGLGELNGYFLLQRCKVPSAVSVATSVFVVAVTAIAASVGHVYKFVATGSDDLQTVLNLVIFTVPGVIIGGQLGSRVAGSIPQKYFEKGLGALFIIVAAITLGAVFLKP